jgi:hypothetical protein
MGIHLKGDERILGDGDFVESILEQHNEHLEQRYRLQVGGYDFDNVVNRVAKLSGMPLEETLSPGKQPKRVRPRGLVCYWAAERGEKYARDHRLKLIIRSIA